jgi:hypothetical protein
MAATGNLRWPLVTILALYIIPTLFLAFAQPMDLGRGDESKFSPPDESAHVAYFEELTETLRLPVFSSGVGNYEAHQPPMYYLALWPVYVVSRSMGKAASIIALRIANVGLGSLSIVVLWRIALLGFPTSPSAAALATAIGALWPARLIACTAVSNDVAAELASLAAVLALCRLVQQRPGLRQVFRAGLLVGLAMLVKSSTLPLIVVGLAAIYLAHASLMTGQSVSTNGKGIGSTEPGDQTVKRGRAKSSPAAQEARGNSWRTRMFASAGLFMLGLCLLWGPWAIRNTALYGDPLAAAAFERIFKQDRATPEFFLDRGLSGLQYYELVLWQTGLSFWGVFGQSNLWLPWPYYLFAGAWWAATLGLAGAKLIARPDNSPHCHRPTCLVLALQLALTAAFFLRFNAVFYQAQARYFMPATAGIGLLLAWPWVWPNRRKLAWAGIGLFVALALCAVLLFLEGMTSPVVPMPSTR